MAIKEFKPIPGARQKGLLAKNPIVKQATADEIQVAKKTAFQSAGLPSPLFVRIFGFTLDSAIIPIQVTNCFNHLYVADDNISITGFVGKPEIARGTRNQQSLYLNKRYIKI